MKVIFHWRSSSTEAHLPPKVAFNRRSYSTEGQLPPKIVFHRRLSSTEGYLPLKVIFHQILSPTEGLLPPKVVFHRRSSSIKGRLPPTITPWLILYLDNIKQKTHWKIKITSKKGGCKDLRWLQKWRWSKKSTQLKQVLVWPELGRVQFQLGKTFLDEMQIFLFWKDFWPFITFVVHARTIVHFLRIFIYF